MNDRSAELSVHGVVRGSWAAWCGILAAAAFASCGGGGGFAGSGNQSGQIVEVPGHGAIIVDPNEGGNAQQVRIVRVAWGRLVEVFGLDDVGNRIPMQENFVISGSLDSDGQNYLLETNPVTTQQNLVILRDVGSETGRAQFFSLLLAAEQNLTPVFDTSPSGAGIFTMVPRNSAMVVQFTDLIDAGTVGPLTLRVLTGVAPATVPFEGRLLMDPNHGDVIGGAFHSTRTIIDTTVSLIDSFVANPPLPVNGVGLPAAVDVNLSNVSLRIPTEFHLPSGQNVLLSNLSGHYVTASNNGTVDFTVPTVDVTRAARSGGPFVVTGDPFNGFMKDEEPPEVVGSIPVTIDMTPIPLPGEDEFLLPSTTFASLFCAHRPEAGDVFTQTGLFAEVVGDTAFLAGSNVTGLVVRLLLFPEQWASSDEWLNTAVGEASYRSTFDPLTSIGREACFVTVFPTPTGFPNEPTRGLFTDSRIGVRFSEPMDPTSLTAFDSMTLTRSPLNPGNNPPLPTSEYVVGSVVQTLDLQGFSFTPDLPLAHEAGIAESYYLALVTGELGPTDLAGNDLAVALPQVENRIDAAEASQHNGGRVSRFNGQDEEPPIGVSEPLPEWSGQHLYDLTRQLIKPRPVQRFLALADRSQPVPALMTPFSLGVQTPLSPLGSKMQTLYRYVDFGFSLTDGSNYNLDVEGLHWSPSSGNIVADNYAEFEIRLSHCRFAPDEYIDPGSLFPAYPASGLEPAYVDNPLEPGLYPQSTVHPKALGYAVVPGNLFTATSGTRLIPYPLNQTIPMTDWRTYTWRDTSIQERAGPFGAGADPRILYVALGLAPPALQFYSQGQVQSIGLPLLMEFRCYPHPGAVGLNAFDISIAVNSSSRPYFRAFSTGGFNTSGIAVQINPDLEATANGGFNPTSLPTPGSPTFGRDPVFYIGGVDMVVRVSRSYSIWFPADDPSSPDPFLNPVYNPPLLEPRSEEQPTGTEILLSFRGTDSVNNEDAQTNAATIDNYGDHYAPPTMLPPRHNVLDANLGDVTSMSFLTEAEYSWKDDISLIDGNRYYQIRITFLSNMQTGLGPELSALALSWQE